MSMLTRKGTIRHGRNTIRKSNIQRASSAQFHGHTTTVPSLHQSNKHNVVLRDQQLLNTSIRPCDSGRSLERESSWTARPGSERRDRPRSDLDLPLVSGSGLRDERGDRSSGQPGSQLLREKEEQEASHTQRNVVCSTYVQARKNQHAEAPKKLFDPLYEHDDLYQAAASWHREASLEQTERSEVLQQVLEANKDADGAFDFVCRFTDIISTTMASTVLLFLTLVLPVAMITMGVKYLDDCPLEKRVPVFLLVGGCFGALKLLGMLWKNVQIRRYESMDAFYDSPDSELAFTSRTFRMMDWILSAFLLTWHAVGAFWVFAIWRPPFSPSLHEPNNYCGTSVYMFAVSEILFVGVALTLLLLYCLVLALCYKYTNVFEK